MSLGTPKVYAVIVLEKPIFILHGVYGVVLYRCENSKESLEISIPPLTSISASMCFVASSDAETEAGEKYVLTC
jgi:hypothetical protein